MSIENDLEARDLEMIDITSIIKNISYDVHKYFLNSINENMKKFTKEKGLEGLTASDIARITVEAISMTAFICTLTIGDKFSINYENIAMSILATFSGAIMVHSQKHDPGEKCNKEHKKSDSHVH